MVRWLVLCSLLAAVGCNEGGAEPPTLRFDRAAPHCADAARDCVQAGASTFELRGLRVIHKRVPGEPLVVASILFDRNGIFADAKEAHAQYLLMRLISWWGSQAYLENWDALLGRIGATHWSVCAADYAHTGVVVPAANFQQAFHLLASAVLTPPITYLDNAELSKIKAGYRQEFAAVNDDPGNAASAAGWSLIADQHPYNVRGQQLAQLQDVDTNELYRAQTSMFDRNRATVVVVGDVERERVENLVREELFTLSAQTERPLQPGVAPLRASSERARIVTMESAPNWQIRGYFPTVSAVEEARFAALQLGARALSRRLFDEVRDELGLAYSVQLSIANYRAAYGTLSLGTVSPNEAMRSVRETTSRMLSEGISDEELEGARATYLTELFASTQNAYGLAIKLGDWELTAGDSALLDAHLSAIGEVTAADATTEIGTALKELRYGAAGPSPAIDEHVLFGED